MAIKIKTLVLFCSVLVLGAFAVHLAVNMSNDTKQLAVERSLEYVAARISASPAQLRGWDSTEAVLDQSEFAKMNLEAYSRRLFRNIRTGEELLVYVVAGTARHVAIHSPDFSYRYGGFSIVSGPEHRELELSEDRAGYATCSFEKRGPASPESMVIVWSHAADGTWRAPSRAKVEFAEKPVSIKVYFISQKAGLGTADEKLCVSFAREYLPLFNAAIFDGGLQVTQAR